MVKIMTLKNVQRFEIENGYDSLDHSTIYFTPIINISEVIT